jgi:hypothetical protein
MVSRKSRGRLGIEEANINIENLDIPSMSPPLPDFPDTKEIQRKLTPPLNNPRLLFCLNLSAVTYGARTELRSAGCFLTGIMILNYGCVA